MATRLNKTVTRDVLIYPFQGKYRNKNVILKIEPSGIISFRAKGTKKEYSTTLHTCFNLAFVHSIMNDYDQKMKLYLVKKKAGMRVKKPKKPFVPFKFV